MGKMHWILIFGTELVTSLHSSEEGLCPSMGHELKKKLQLVKHGQWDFKHSLAEISSHGELPGNARTSRNFSFHCQYMTSHA